MSQHKERIIGSSILLGGGLLLSAVFYRINYVEQPELTTKPGTEVVAVVPMHQRQDDSVMSELTADYQTEQRILAEKKQARAARVAEQERMVKDYLRVQDEATRQALRKADREFANRYPESSTVIEEQANTNDAIKVLPLDVMREEERKLAERRKAHERYEAMQKAKQQQALDAKKSQQTDLEREQARRKQQEKRQQQQREKEQQLLAERRKEALRKKQLEDKKRREQELAQSYGAAKKKLKEARANAIMNNAKGTFGVQVALAANQEMADSMAAKLKKHGYKVATSNTSRGVRVIVGPERGKAAALALKDKVNADKRLGMGGAWVLHMKPEHLAAQKRSAEQAKARAKAKKAADKKAAQRKAEKAKQAKRDAERTKAVKAAKEKAAEAKAKQSAAEDKSRYGVQVAMAGTKESADALIAKLKLNGYNVTTSHTTRGTRIIVGVGLKKDAAKKLQAKVNADSRLNVSGAWLRRER